MDAGGPNGTRGDAARPILRVGDTLRYATDSPTVDKMWTEWLIPGLIPFTIPAKDQTLQRIDKKPLHEAAKMG